MFTRTLATVSAVLLGTAGVALLFAADEIIAALAGGSTDPTITVMVQLLGGAWLALAWATWLTRGTPQGGIYGRPIVMANATLYFIAALVCLRGAAASGAVRAAAIVSSVMAVAYGLVMFGKSPGEQR